MNKICRILLVEDEDEIAKLLADLFDDEGYRVMRVASGPDGLRAVERDASDLDAVILDMTLPGGQVVFEIADRAAAAGLGVVLVTGDPARVAAMEASGYRFLLKPFRLNELLATVETALAESQSRCEPRRRAS